MFYIGKIIGAFFNQLFRFLFWNKGGQKIFILIIICLIAFWCLNMTQVHAVEQVIDINYDLYSYYEGVVNDAISRLGRVYVQNPDAPFFNEIKAYNSFGFYFYWGSSNDGSNMANSRPSNKNRLVVIEYPSSNSYTKTPTTNDYASIPNMTLYNFSGNNIRYREIYQQFSSTGIINSFYIPNQLYLYKTTNWLKFEDYVRNGNTQDIIGLLEDIKAEQQATNEFLNQETDTSLIAVDTPSISDSSSDNMSNNLHNQINTLTTDMQNVVNNYYEGQDAYTWRIPLPSYIGGDIRFDSGVTRRIIGTSGVVYNVIQAVWVLLFGGYIVSFIKRMLDWIQTGKIFDEGGLADFIWWMDTNNEIIKASMM